MKKRLAVLLSFMCLFACACESSTGASNEGGNSNVSDSVDSSITPSTENVVTTTLNGLVKQASRGFETETAEEWGVINDYVLETAVRPIWTTRNVYNETVSFIGKDDVATLMYTPTKIHKVYDYYQIGRAHV